ncbi:MAG: threonine--tRNA ligase, partial [Actinobacteria bacterium]|nr:threonine--tRNA ligase [Actinomycetota bacterium]
MSLIAITVDGAPVSVESDQRPTHLFQEQKDVVVCRINGVVSDLWSELAPGDVIEAITIASPEGLKVLRHSTAHVLAQAVQQLFPQTRLGIGPPITDGFYYDFDPPKPFTPDDLTALESAMKKIIKDGQRFRRRVTTEADALKELAAEPYKCELVGLKSDQGDESSVEVGGAELTIYDNLGRDGQPVWSDLCRGPHLPSTKLIPAFKLMRSAGAYWRGSEKNPMLQRIYGTAWASQEDLAAYLEFLVEAEKRDHRRLGTELDLFSFPEEIGSGLAVFHPKGGIIRRAMEDYSRKRHEEEGYEFVYSPHITKAALFEKSGHLDWYSEGMYPPMILDEELHADGTVKRAGQQYYMKPMNCPFHNLIYSSRGRSYRELPLRLFEFGTVYRYEKSGVLHGITRARGFTQDDAHIYCTADQMLDELDSLLTFVLNLLRDYGLTDFYLELSTRNDEKFVGEDAEWERATEALRISAQKQNLELVLDPGGAAFYGPKVSVQA